MPPRLLKGAIPTPRNLLSAAAPHANVGATPPECLWLPKRMDMWGNATFGDCVTAEEAFAKSCYDPEVFIPATKVIRWARKNNVLNGAGLWEVMKLMQTGGFDQDFVTYNDGPFKAVNWRDIPLLQNAIAQSPVKLGVASDQIIKIPQAGVSDGWIGTGLTPGDPQDHCISLCGFGSFAYLAARLVVALPSEIEGGTSAYAVFTWGTIGILDEPSLFAIVGEAWLRTPVTIKKPDPA